MNKDESVAEKYLNPYHDTIKYEPDGNIPPDFSINNSIGVEVRRLNQQHRNDGNTRGLEEQSIPLVNAVWKELSQYPHDANGNNYWLNLRYKRGFGKLKDIKKKTRSAVSAFQSQHENIPFSYDLSRNVKLKFIAKEENLSIKYNLGIMSDQDSGGWVGSIYIQEISHCISEKEAKIKPHIENYKSWWLLLVDNIGFMDSDDIESIVNQIVKPACFDKVIVIKSDGSKQFEI